MNGHDDDLRARCHGMPPLPGRLEPWQVEVLGEPGELVALVERHGSPVNLIDPRPLARHAAELVDAGGAFGLTTRVFFARKANKALALVDAAAAAGHGVDVASHGELVQVLDRGVDPSAVILTAAVKPRHLLEIAVAAGVTISVDSLDELALLEEAAHVGAQRTPVALRCTPEAAGVPPSRFGLTAAQVRDVLDGERWRVLRLAGFHLHLAGYDHRPRAVVVEDILDLVATARWAGHRPEFIDIGGGVPMRYLESAEPWERFWRQHRAAVATGGATELWSGSTLGLRRGPGGEVNGVPTVYPMWQDPVGGAWLTALLDWSQSGRTPLGRCLAESGLALHLEPGRSLVDGCGLAVARVESRKQATDGRWYIGLAMNRTQCRSAAEDFLLDPILLPTGRGARTGSIEGYLVGTYCIESDLITQRRLRFPRGVAVGDLVVFVNTAGYQMHILESASHQIPLARNLIRTESGWGVDDVDRIALAQPGNGETVPMK